MPRRKRVPKYGLHKPSGQARVILNGRHVCLGPYGSPESRELAGRRSYFVGDDEANRRLTRDYRAPFVVPERLS